MFDQLKLMIWWILMTFARLFFPPDGAAEEIMNADERRKVLEAAEKRR